MVEAERTRLLGIAAAGAKVGQIAPAWQKLATTLSQMADQEQGRFILWMPVWLIVGIALYFRLHDEPAAAGLWAGLLVAGALWGSAAKARHGALTFGARILVCVALGAVLAQLRVAQVTAPILERSVGPIMVIGTVVDVEHRPRAERLIIMPHQMEGMATAKMPARVRVTWRGDPSEARAGDKVRVRAMLSPPPTPATPGGFDYGRQLFFEQIGGVGFTYGPARVIARPDHKSFAVRVALWRQAIAARILRTASDEAGPVLMAMVTGKRAQIPEAITDQLRDTGLAHLLAISGLHMGLVCGFLFVGLRFIFVQMGALALNYPIKKWAAVGALMGGVFYLILSGGAWSAQRAFIMAAISFIAILFDRRAISLRNVALAALIILVLRPEAVLSAGFHMSFAAVMALIAAYDFWHQHKGTRGPDGLFMMPFRFVGGLSATSLIAGLATGPFAIYHFNRIAVYGLIANLAVMPVFTLLVMPVAVMGLIMMPLGLDSVFWAVASWGIEVMLAITKWIAGWPGAVQLVPQWPLWAWLACITGMILLCLLRAPWRFGAVLLFPLAWGGGQMAAPPLVQVAEDANNVGVVMSDGSAMQLASRRRERFTANRWLQQAGINGAIRDQPKFGECGADMCTTRLANGARLAVVQTQAAAEVACLQADIVVAQLWTEGGLQNNCLALYFSARSVALSGPVAIFADGAGWRVQTDAAKRRPWSKGGVP